MDLQLGQRVIATRTTAICNAGERGVVYEVYSREHFGGGGEGQGVSIIFERGGYDGFSPDEQRMMTRALDEFCPFASGYDFQNVGRLTSDYRKGLFTFSKEGQAVRPEVRAALQGSGGKW